MSVKAQANTSYVDDSNVLGPWDGTLQHPYLNMTSALVHVLSGDTIFVFEGTYREGDTMTITTSGISLIGEDRDSTIIDANETWSAFYVAANDVLIEGFTLMRSSEVSPRNSAIRTEHSTGTIIRHNKIIENNDGINVLYSSNNQISDNIISSNNRDSIGIYFSGNNIISGNVISSNQRDGIGVYFSSDNVISGNTISSNGNYGIYYDFNSTLNIAYHNNLNNTNQVWSTSSNGWDYVNEGNYWADYQGKDLNEDGLGDSPYNVNVDNRDNSPLMGAYYDFTITSETGEYEFSVVSNSTVSNFSYEVGAETGNKIIQFDVEEKGTSQGFCRVKMPARLMNYSLVTLVDDEGILPKSLNISSEMLICQYFTYSYGNHNIKIISSRSLYLYNELMDKYVKLQTDLNNLNNTYLQLLSDLNLTYFDLLTNLNLTYLSLLNNLNLTYIDLLVEYGDLLMNYTQLRDTYLGLNASYQDHLMDYSENAQNLRNLMYVFAATTAFFLMTTIYLSKHAHASMSTRRKIFEDMEET
jgi:parallel beta-helix repeat protein